MKANNYTEAVLHYSHGLQLDSTNHILYSNRSLAFLRIDQHYLALEDAKKVIELEPTWPKGYYRKGEVEHAAGYFTQALISYQQAQHLGQSDATLQEAITRTTRQWHAQKKEQVLQPWLYTGGGLAIGLMIVLADQFITKEPAIKNNYLCVLLLIMFGAAGYGVSRTVRYISSLQKRSLLDPPPDLLAEMEGKPPKPAESNDKEDHFGGWKKKGNASAARHRYQQGKS